MGVTTIAVNECLDFTREPGRVHVYGSFVLTAANGDELQIAVNKVGELPGSCWGRPVAGPYDVTGGTGRFVTAIGGDINSTDANVFAPTSPAKLIGAMRR